MSADKVIDPAFSLTKNPEPLANPPENPVILYPVDTGPASDNEKVPLDELSRCNPLSILKTRESVVADGVALIVVGNWICPII